MRVGLTRRLAVRQRIPEPRPPCRVTRGARRTGNFARCAAGGPPGRHPAWRAGLRALSVVGKSPMSNERSPRVRAATVLVAECALVLACLSAHFPQLWAERWAQDDAYVSFRYARNLVRGNGLVYNVGEPVEGYTNFLWTVLAAVPLARGANDPLPFMHVASALLWCLSYALLLAIAIRLWAAGCWAAPLGLLPLALHWSFNMWFFSGMETPLVTFLTIAAVACATVDPRRHRWSLPAMTTCAVGLMMTRPDGAIVFAALLLAVALLDGWWLLRFGRMRILAARAAV